MNISQIAQLLALKMAPRMAILKKGKGVGGGLSAPGLLLLGLFDRGRLMADVCIYR